MIDAVRSDQTQQHMYYSKNESKPLIDMIYCVNDEYHAIQATIGKEHDTALSKIRNLKMALGLGQGKKLQIFYAIPSSHYGDFATTPINPLFGQNDLTNVLIYHVSVSFD